MTPFSHSPNYAHAHKYALIQSKIDAFEKVLDELETVRQILQGYILAKKRPILRDLKPLIEAFDAYPVGMVDYPTVPQKVCLSLADGSLLIAKSMALLLFHGLDVISLDVLNAIEEHLSEALGTLFDCYALVEDKVVPKKKH
ncbi:hypothetical protein [Runella sp. SP2]|uniref:hypothetical protein n=1 Tax=Runella sp. SP2 TaxID=2268026 RepID=UPI000F082FFD|nr:hypothetical protein [Runella sp. SP2]AYQ34946.1 hypothetical protein DTQ70_23500 [Runella sp. SP2]